MSSLGYPEPEFETACPVAIPWLQTARRARQLDGRFTRSVCQSKSARAAQNRDDFFAECVNSTRRNLQPGPPSLHETTIPSVGLAIGGKRRSAELLQALESHVLRGARV